MDSERLTVVFRECGCPDTPHPDGDTVEMRPALGFAAGAEALRKMGEAMVIVALAGGGPKGDQPIVDTSRTAELVGPVYIREGVIGWNVVDENGPVPLDIDMLLNDYTLAYPIAMAGDDLYSDVVTAPLVKATSKPSANGLNGKPTRQARRSSEKARSPRKSSSRNGSAGLPSPVNQ